MEQYQLKSFSLPPCLDYQKNLNHQQIKVVEDAEGPCLVLAGAGSGKTRVLIYRLYYLLQKGVSPRNILLVTFTNKAAREMINRAETLVKSTLTGLWAGTFHHIGNIMLRHEAETLGFSPNFTIIDKEDSQGFLEDCLEELGFLNREKLFPAKNIISEIYSLSANCQLSIDEIVPHFYPQVEMYIPHLKKILAHYTKKKQEANLMDFDDLLLNWFNLLGNETIRSKYAETFRYILIDEYQDTNRLQFEIIKRLASSHNNLLVVGDDAQSIYSFRGAEIRNVLDFPKIFPKTSIFKLEINYRSTPEILNLANKIIQHNINQFPKVLQTNRTSQELPCIVKTQDVYQQAKFVAQRLLELHREGIPLKEIAILFRSRFQALELEIELMKRNIPYVVRGGVRFFEQAHIKDVMAHLKILLNPQDELAFKRAIALHRGIGRAYAQKVWNQLTVVKKSLSEIEKGLPQRQKLGFQHFFSIIESLKNISSPQQAIQAILQFYKDYCYLSFDNPEERIHDLEELAKMAVQYPTIRRFLVELNSYETFKGESILAAAEKQEVVVLSTIHQAKGLEWEAVFIIGVNEYDFPHPKALTSSDDIEEERRLFYVAVTRTKTLLTITYPEVKYTSKNNVIICRASSFLEELPRTTYREITIEEIY